MNGLFEILKKRIAGGGPISVAEYMGLALGHPEHGYYMRRDPLGRAGDFITAPEISQMFGELIGLWCAVVWRQMGAPAPVHLVELGPGRGTLMADALRAADTSPGFKDALDLHFIETSPLLRDAQAKSLVSSGCAPAWHADFSDLPDGPVIAVANEFFDALPIRQFVHTQAGWRERLVGLDAAGGGLIFVDAESEPRAGVIAGWARTAPIGAVIEIGTPAAQLAAQIGRRIAAFGGAALIIDYGHETSAPGDTFQAVKGHEYADVLADPGAADLTAHVDFAAISAAAAEAGARIWGPLGQGDFLISLGIRERAERLTAGAGAAAAEENIPAALERLIAGGEMGKLFKVLAIDKIGQPAPPGFG